MDTGARETSNLVYRRGALKVILWRNRRLKSRKCPLGPSLRTSVSMKKVLCCEQFILCCDLLERGCCVRVVRGAPNVIVWQNRRLKSQNVTSGPSLLRSFQYRNICAVNDSSCAVIYGRGTIVRELSGERQRWCFDKIGDWNHKTWHWDHC